MKKKFEDKFMRALVISGGGSKGAFAGGVAQYLLEVKKNKYDIFIGTSTGSLLISHLALNKIKEIREVYTNVNQYSIFSNCPFTIRCKNGVESIRINHLNVLWSFIKGAKTFGESLNLKKLIKNTLTKADFETLKNSDTEIVVAVTNLTRNEPEYKSIRDYDYDDFCEWIWISCNYVPFMSVVNKNNSNYGDGGFSALVPIHEAVKKGAKEIDVIILDTETDLAERPIEKNAFSLLVNLFDSLLDQVRKSNIEIGILSSLNKDVKLNFYYTPDLLTSYSLVFNKKKMEIWWKEGYEYAKNKSVTVPVDSKILVSEILK